MNLEHVPQGAEEPRAQWFAPRRSVTRTRSLTRSNAAKPTIAAPPIPPPPPPPPQPPPPTPTSALGHARLLERWPYALAPILTVTTLALVLTLICTPKLASKLGVKSR